MHNICYADGIWVATGDVDSYNYGIYYSTNGKTWAQSNITSDTNSFRIYYANNILLASNYSDLYYSEITKNITDTPMSDNNNEINTTLITFTIDDITYQAEEGMTWAEWITSAYRKNNMFSGVNDNISSNVIGINNEYLTINDGNDILEVYSNTIVADASYIWLVDDSNQPPD